MIEELRPIAEAIRARGGRAVAVGGFVRDLLIGRPAAAARDLDVEVFELTAPELAQVLRGFGEVLEYGRSFPVMRVVGREIDFALARGADFAAAARHRDLTIHAIGLDPLTGEILDPLGGRADLAARALRAADPGTFGSDPLRGLRVAQIAARFAMEPDAELVALCRALDLAGLPGERLRVEFDKLLLLADQPGRGLAVLRRTELLRFFPELAAPDAGGVWEHTERALDAAARLRTGGDGDSALMYAVFCVDFGAAAARGFFERLRAPNALTARVLALVEHHDGPVVLAREDAKPPAYRRLVRRLDEAGVSAALLERVARADHFGRSAPDAIANRFPEGDRFLAEIAQLVGGSRDVVWGRHLLEYGFIPGPEFTQILARCREVQDETGWRDPQAILRRALNREPD
jgi:tRNA nucleotidyltransferase (CCA-adding enzyme)